MNWLKEEKEKLSKLSGKRKAAYIWDYYKLWIIGIVVLLFILIYMIGNIIHATRDNFIYVTYVNTFTDIGQDSDFWNGFVDYSGVDTSEKNVIFDDENYFDMSSDDETGNHYYEKAVVLFDSETLDAIVLEPENLAKLGESGRLIDLNNPKTSEIAEKYKDRLITITHTDENGEMIEIPVGIDISDSILVTDEGAYTECALGISAHSQNIQAVNKFLSYILQEE